MHTASIWPSSPAGRPRAACSPRPSARVTCAAMSRCSPKSNAAASTTARKLAALRALFASQREHGLIAQNPADLVSTPRRSSYLPRVLKAREAAKLLDSIGAGGLGGQSIRAGGVTAGWAGHSFNATARCSSSPTRAGCAPRSSYRFGSRTSTTTASSCASKGKGRKTRYLPVGEVAMAAVRLYLERGRNGLTSPGASAARVRRGASAVPE